MIVSTDKPPSPMDNTETPPPYISQSIPSLASSSTLPGPTTNPLAASSLSPSPSSPFATPTSPGVPAVSKCNFTKIKKSNDNIKGTFVIDPDLPIPESMLAQLEENEERRNLCLFTKNGNVSVDLYLVSIYGSLPGRGIDVKPKRTTLEVTGDSVKCKLHTVDERPFTLSITATHGNVQLDLPRSFKGPLTTEYHHGTVSFSGDLSSSVATFSDVDRIQKCFVGDFNELHFGHGEWLGSSITIKCPQGNVKLRFVDDIKLDTERKRGWWWGS